MSCLVCDRIALIRKNANPWFVKELETGYVVMGDHQHFRGYTLLLCKEHASELHELAPAFKLKFLEEMSLVAEAVYKAFRPDKLNYELLGMGDAHMHWHIFPRRAGDTPRLGPVWWKPIDEWQCDAAKPSAAQLDEMIALLRYELDR